MFYYEILNSPDQACLLAKQAFDDAIAGMLSVSPKFSIANVGFRTGYPERGELQGLNFDHAAPEGQFGTLSPLYYF